MISGCRSRSHDSSALSAAIISGPTGHRVSSKSKLKTSGVIIDKALPARMSVMSLSEPNGAPLLVLGSKNYSSWSLRPWLFLRKVGFEFQEQVIHFDAIDYQAQIAAHSPSRCVPLLIAGGAKVWDSIA